MWSYFLYEICIYWFRKIRVCNFGALDSVRKVSVGCSSRESTRCGRWVRGVVSSWPISPGVGSSLSGVVVTTRPGACCLTDRFTTTLIGAGGGTTGWRRGGRLFRGGRIGVGVLFFCSAGSIGDVGHNVVTGRLHRTKRQTDVTLLFPEEDISNWNYLKMLTKTEIYILKKYIMN